MPQGIQIDPLSFPDQGEKAPAGGLDPSAFPDQQKQTEPAAKKPVQTSGVERLVENFLQRSVVDPVMGVVGMGQSVVKKLQSGSASPILETGQDIAAGIGQQSLEQIRKAKAAFAEGRYGAAAGRAAASIPVIGPMGAQLYEQAASGDVAGAIGGAGGVAATLVGPKALGKVPAAPVRAAGSVPLTIAERGGSKVAGFAENVVERTVPGSGVFERFRSVQQTALRDSADRIADAISSERKTGTSAGAAVQRGLEAGEAEAKALSRRVYGLIDDIVKTETKRVPVVEQVPSQIVGPSGEALTVPKRTMKKVEVGGVQPETRSLKLAAIPMLRRIQQESELIPPKELAGVRSMLEQIVNAPPRLPFAAFQDARSSLLSIVRRFDDPLPGKTAGIAKKIAKETDEAMMTAAEESGIPNLGTMVREANDLYRQGKEIFNDAYIKRIAQASPEDVPHLIRHIDLDDLKKLQAGVPRPVFDVARARVMRDLFEDATSNKPAPPLSVMEQVGITPEGRPVNQPTSTLSGKRMQAQIRDLGPEKMNALFGPESSKQLVEIAELAERIGSRGPSGPTRGLIAAGVNATIFAPVLGFVGLPKALGTYAGFNLAAHVLTHPQGLGMYRNFLRAVGSGNTPLALAIGTRLSAMLEENKLQPVASHPQAPPVAASR